MTDEDPTLLISRDGQRGAIAELDASDSDTPRRIGRYVVFSKLGAGGGGMVFRAYDPDLHRQVAIKILRPGGHRNLSSPERLLREAQAIAQLSHPNVIAVHDVGVVGPDAKTTGVLGVGDVFVVMELAPGPTLREWLKEKQRPWREVLEVMIAAGRGLAAAHARGLVHRDFKPANVLVGSDGRVRVLDFGLARLVGQETSGDQDTIEPPSPRSDVLETSGEDPDTSSRRLLSSDLTGAGDVVGTPSYMAPEQHAGHVADERTDQYGYCVALFEALAGRKPFEGRTSEALLRAKLHGCPPLGDLAVPRRIMDAVARGLSPLPEDRFASMPALLAALEDDPAQRWKKRVPVAAVGLALAAMTAMGVQASRSSEAACADSDERLSGIWDDAVRARAEASFSGTELPYAADAWSSVVSSLTHHAQAWVDERDATCRAALVEGRQSTEAMAAQMLCLDRALDRVRQMSLLLQNADEDVVQNAVAMVRRLEPPEACRDASEELAGRLRLTDSERAVLLALDSKVEQADVLRESGKYEEAQTIATEVNEAAQKLEDWGLVARASHLLCRVALANDSVVTAEEHCRSAVDAAERSGDPVRSIEPLAWLGRVSSRVRKRDAAELLLHLAAVRLEALPETRRSYELEAMVAETQGHLAMDRDDHAAAQAHYQRALEVLEARLGPDHPDLLPSLNGLALAAQDTRDFERARARYARARSIAEQAYGKLHPIVGALLNNEGGLALLQKNHDEALSVLQRALEIKKATLPADSPRLLTTTRRIGAVLANVGRLEEALPYLREALRLHLMGVGESSLETIESRLPLAQTLRKMGRLEEALAEIEIALPIAETAGEDGLESRIALLRERGWCLVAKEDLEGAAAALEPALALGTDAAEPSSTWVWALVDLGALRTRLRDEAGALEVLEKAYAAAERASFSPEDLAKIELDLAELVERSDPDRSKTLVERARNRIIPLDEEAPELRARLDARDRK